MNIGQSAPCLNIGIILSFVPTPKVLKIKFDTYGRQDLISEQTYSIADILYMLKKGNGLL